MERIQRMFNKNFNSIYESCRRMSITWGLKYISITYLEVVIKIARSMTVNNPDDVEAVKIQKAYYDVLDQILKTCKTQAKSIGSDGVSFDFLKGCIKSVKEHFNEDLK